MSLRADIRTARETWEAIPSDWRAKVDAALHELGGAELPEPIRVPLVRLQDVGKRIAMKAIAEGIVGGSWANLPKHLSAAWPALYDVVRGHLPK